MKVTQEHIENYREKLQNYITKENIDLYTNDTIILDMLYFAGVSIDCREFAFATGFDKFLNLVREVIDQAQSKANRHEN